MQQNINSGLLNVSDLQVWEHPVLTNAIEALEVFSSAPGDGKLAASLVLLSQELLDRKLSVKPEANHSTLTAITRIQNIRDRSQEWLLSQVSSDYYPSDPARATSQSEKCLVSALLLLSSQITRHSIPPQIQAKAFTYVNYIAEKNWPQSDLSALVVSFLLKPSNLQRNAKKHLILQVDKFRNPSDAQGISYILIGAHDLLDQVSTSELIAVLVAEVSRNNIDLCAKTWSLIALSRYSEQKNLVDSLAISILDELSQDRLVNSPALPVVRLVNEFPFHSPKELRERITMLKQRAYAPASAVKDVFDEGVLIDVFNAAAENSWTFGMNAGPVAFACFGLVRSGYDRIIGAPIVFRSQIEQGVLTQKDLQDKRSRTIPLNYLRWYNVLAVIISLQMGWLSGVLLALLLVHDWLEGGWIGLALVAAGYLVRFATLGNEFLTKEFLLVDLWKTISASIGSITGSIKK